MQKIGIIGLGLNGLIASISMKIAGFEVASFETSEASFLTKDNRTSALTFETIEFFKELQIFDELKDFIAPIKHIYTFEITQAPILSFESEKVSENPFGYVVQNSKLKEVLIKKLNSLEIPIISSKISNLESTNNFHNISLENGDSIKCKLILNCSGKASASFSTGKRHEFDYNQTAFVFNISHEKEHQNIAIESFSPEGPIAILPLLTQLNSAVILTVKTETGEYLKSVSKENFLEEFKKMTSRMKHVGQIFEITSDFKSYPLALSFKASQVGKRMLLLGDCFNTIHPVAGQAFNMSLKDIKNLYSEGKIAIKLGLDVGGETFLTKLSRKNLKHHIEMNLFTHFLVKIFSNQSKVLKVLRNFGIEVLEKTSPLKKFLMKKASGI